ncbi:hypothetical protein [Clostridium sp.]|uniref:hypothetical protein n=1 Tax=Clostridium sp. TaxID=1506 RepID=UPI0029128C8A|nr:hypothetical protein [Clostridium sp.]MDU4846397.1 hypothetical protein [Clostridium sp.]
MYELFNPFPKIEKVVYGKIINSYRIEDKAIITISLLNNEMIEYDKDIYSSRGLLNTIMNYLNNENQNDTIHIKRITKIINKYELENYIGDIRELKKYNRNKKINKLKSIFNEFKPYFYECTITIDIRRINFFQKYKFCYKCDNTECSENIFNGYIPFVLTCNENTISERKDGIETKILFSASPIRVVNGVLYLIDDNIEEKYKAQKIEKNRIKNFRTSKSIIKNINRCNAYLTTELNKCFPKNIYKIKYTMYHIGQGLCSYISFNRNFGIFYDIGFSKCGTKDTSINFDKKNTYNRFLKNKPRAIILSHWDTDHILGIVYADENIYDKVWIAPDINYIKNITDSALRLSRYLSLREKLNNIASKKYKRTLFLISKDYNNKKVYNNSNLVIYKGKGTATDKHSNKVNNIGLIVEIENRCKNLLLTGDVDYFKMPDELITRNFNYLQVPHHGGDVGFPIFKPKIIAESIAIVPVSPNYNIYKHPNNIHLSRLACSGFIVIQSNDFQQYNDICNSFDKDKYIIEL